MNRYIIAAIMLLNCAVDNSMRAVQAGTLDPTFDGDGKVVGPIGEARGIAIQSDGKIVAAGFDSTDFVVARYNTNGSLDTSFGAPDGFVTTSFGPGSTSIAHGVALYTSGSEVGKIIVTGQSNASGSDDFALARYNSDGSLDATFGTGGLVLTNFSVASSDIGHAVLIQPSDNYIVAVGESTAPANGPDFALARYDTSGALDATFNPGGALPPFVPGLVTTNFGVGSSDIAYAVALQPSDNYIVAAGVSNNDFALARYDVSGNLDNANFGAPNGWVTTDFSALDDIAYGVTLQSNGKIIAVGQSGAPGSEDFALARYETNGNLDVAFGSGGLVTTSFGGADAARACFVDPAGRIVAAGHTDAGGQSFALARYRSTGALDNTFGVGGLVKTIFAEGAANGYAVAQQADRKIVVAGGAGNDFALARYFGIAPVISPISISFTRWR